MRPRIINVQHRIFGRDDLDGVMSIARASGGLLTSLPAIFRLAGTPDAILGGLVIRNKPVAYVLGVRRPNSVRLVDFAVAPEHRRRGLGRTMLELPMQGARTSGRRITTLVRETNVVAQKFLRALNFRAVRTRRNFYLDTGEDAYRFVYEETARPDTI